MEEPENVSVIVYSATTHAHLPIYILTYACRRSLPCRTPMRALGQVFIRPKDEHDPGFYSKNKSGVLRDYH